MLVALSSRQWELQGGNSAGQVDSEPFCNCVGWYRAVTVKSTLKKCHFEPAFEGGSTV